jgi:hypothetical protein
MCWTRRWPNHALVGFDHKFHKIQLRDEMIENKRNDRGMANDVSVINQIKENTKEKNLCKTS